MTTVTVSGMYGSNLNLVKCITFKAQEQTPICSSAPTYNQGSDSSADWRNSTISGLIWMVIEICANPVRK